MGDGYFDIEQDSDKIRSVGEDILGLRASFDQATQEFYTELNEKINIAKSDKTIWYGPQAEKYAKSAETQRYLFDNALASIDSAIEVLGINAEGWDGFESR